MSAKTIQDGPAFHARSKTLTISPASPTRSQCKHVSEKVYNIMKYLMYAGEKRSQELICKFSDRQALAEALIILKEQGNTPTLLLDENFCENSLILALITDTYIDEEKNGFIQKASDTQLENVANHFARHETNPTEFNRIIFGRPLIFKGKLENLKETAKNCRNSAIVDAISKIENKGLICFGIVNLVAIGVLAAFSAILIYNWNITR